MFPKTKHDLWPNADGAEVRCWGCGRLFRVRIAQSQLAAWLNGADAVTAMPQVSKSERALLITGYCWGCFEKRFPIAESEFA
jgi:hypothetical protein